MASIIHDTRQAYQTLAELIAATRDIPPIRIRMHPAPGTATETDLLEVHSREGILCELIDGLLVEKTVGSYESLVADYILTAINNYLETNDLGIVLGEAGMLRIAPEQVRIPDVSFIAWQQLPNRELPEEPVWGVHPDLAVEVLSQGNSPAEMRSKLEEYFEFGSRIVWLVDPVTQSVTIHHSPAQSQVVTRDETLTGDDVLPGFSIPLTRIFRDQRIR